MLHFNSESGLKQEQSHRSVVFSSAVLPDGKGREEEAAADWFHLHSSVQFTHDHSRLSAGEIIWLRAIVIFICAGKVSL